MKFKEFITEHIVSIGFNDDQEKLRAKYKDEIFSILQKAYSHPSIGGYGKLESGSVAESAAIKSDIDNSLIKASIRNGKITAVALYKKSAGRKCIASGTDGSKQGLLDFKKNKLEDIKQERAWAEVSGKPEAIMRALGAPVVPSEQAAYLLGKDVKIIDAERYSRKMGDTEAEKVIIGFPKK